MSINSSIKKSQSQTSRPSSPSRNSSSPSGNTRQTPGARDEARLGAASNSTRTEFRSNSDTTSISREAGQRRDDSGTSSRVSALTDAWNESPSSTESEDNSAGTEENSTFDRSADAAQRARFGVRTARAMREADRAVAALENRRRLPEGRAAGALDELTARGAATETGRGSGHQFNEGHAARRAGNQGDRLYTPDADGWIPPHEAGNEAFRVRLEEDLPLVRTTANRGTPTDADGNRLPANEQRLRADRAERGSFFTTEDRLEGLTRREIHEVSALDARPQSLQRLTARAGQNFELSDVGAQPHLPGRPGGGGLQFHDPERATLRDAGGNRVPNPRAISDVDFQQARPNFLQSLRETVPDGGNVDLRARDLNIGAQRFAARALDRLDETGTDLVQGVSGRGLQGAGEGLIDAASGAGSRVLRRVAGPVGYVADGIGLYSAVRRDLADGGGIGQETAEEVGAIGGGIAGGWAGAQLGATIGAFGGPVGVVVGGVVGGAVGGFLGSAAGEALVENGSRLARQGVELAQDVGESVVHAVRNPGETAARLAEGAWNTLTSPFRAFGFG
ncbi:MAG: hypothetical protein KC800_15065 [Candidatus Eremiobacteraeota bacterium]|nr:hypothetical protein [Candidatus Eremiobacteraeota bacterium]